MNKILIFLLLFFCLLICCSCHMKTEKVYYHDVTYVLVDKDTIHNDKYYSKKIEYNTNGKCSFDIYLKDSNQLIERINLETSKSSIAIYDDIIYIIYQLDNKLFYSYKEIGAEYNIFDNTEFVNISEYKYFLQINGNYFITNDIYTKNYYYIEKVSINMEQMGNTVYTIYKTPRAYNVEIDNNNNSVVLSSLNNSETYVYNFSKEVIDSNYKYKSNLAFKNWPKYDEQDNLYFIGKYITYLEDNCLYFSYSKYLGEFDNARHYCTIPSRCMFSSCKTEILRFNCVSNEIESVGILPDGYQVLKLYINGALIIKNNIISYYNYSSKDLTIINEIDASQYYQLSTSPERIKIYLDNINIDKILRSSDWNGICFNFECINN